MPLHTDFLNAADAGHLYNLMRMNFDTMKLFKLSHDDRNRITEIVLRYYKLHLPNMPELQSLIFYVRCLLMKFKKAVSAHY